MTQSSEIWLRLGPFLSALILLNLLELAVPRRSWTVRKRPRLLSNYALVVLNTVLLKLVMPISAVSAALWCQQEQFGIFPHLGLLTLFDVTASLVLLDLAIYGQHLAFHRISVLWRFHKVHHADLDLDVSSGLRFHTIEIMLSMGIKVGIVALIGAPPTAVVLFEMILNVGAMFNHSNIRLRQKFDAVLRLLIVTPDMHRVHHSVIPKETNSNYGFNLSCWDRLFRTYIEQPEKGHRQMELGLPNHRDQRDTNRLVGILLMPFRSQKPR